MLKILCPCGINARARLFVVDCVDVIVLFDCQCEFSPRYDVSFISSSFGWEVFFVIWSCTNVEMPLSCSLGWERNCFFSGSSIVIVIEIV